MTSSGVKLDPSAVDVFNEMKLRHKTQSISFKIESGEIIIDEVCTKEDAGGNKLASNAVQWERFSEKLIKDCQNECRYCVFDYYMEQPQQAAGNRVIEALIFVVWIPETANVRDKMLYASSKDAIKKKLLGLQAEIQATDSDELSPESVESKIRSSKSL